jgi:hypothetical protein
MVFEDDPIDLGKEELLLHFVNPQDYIISNQPIQLQKTFYQYKQQNPKLLLRVSWRIQENEFMPMSFILDTNAPKIYLNSATFKVFLERNIIQIDPDMGVMYLKLFGHNYLVEETPIGHAPANKLGLKILCQLGLQLFAIPTYGYDFVQKFDYLTEEEEDK